MLLSKEQLNRIEEQIINDEFVEAVDHFLALSTSKSDIHRAILLQKSRYTRLENDILQGVISRQEAEVEETRIVDAVLRLLNKLGDSITVVKPITSSPPSAQVELLEAIPNEKVLGINNLRQIAWVARSVEVARCVCRILVSKSDGKRAYGTGFLISADVVMTNNHVISSKNDANNSIIEFNYQHGFKGGDEPTSRYHLDSARFYTNPKLDYSLIGVISDSEKPALNYWGHVQLNPNADPLLFEHVSIIQHPNGGLKQIVMTANQVMSLHKHYIHYTTDTMPGSSGAPIFNDLWQVVGIHRAWDEKLNLNEGVLISHIHVDAQKTPLWPVK